ncbi:hypothetical protein KDI_52040 [Dictyobacter arantiisoli]|uniref:Uncharacterized protein n=1 Tax=Dictyobacter arantiisoli TaxID=2014874 RepID=A0A5A5TJ58_9CHLR|nr:hypothetical protein KDI_52040 [Dictyobacter arantiisoli]
MSRAVLIWNKSLLIFILNTPVSDALYVLRSIFWINMKEAKVRLLSHPEWMQEQDFMEDLSDAINSENDL